MTAATETTGATARDTHGVLFGLVELDLLATHAGARFPFPLRVGEFGRIEEERKVLLAAAGVTLRERGLAGDRGPLGIAAEVVTALRQCRGTVDLVLASPDETVGVVAMVYRSWALLCRQPMTGARQHTTVRIRRVAQNALADELLAMVPEVEAAVTMPITLPPTDRDPAVVDELGRVLPELTGSGQLGATRGGRRTGPDLSWLDSPRGRVRVNRASGGWLSVNPLRPNELRYALDNMAMIARREDDGA